MDTKTTPKEAKKKFDLKATVKKFTDRFGPEQRKKLLKLAIMLVVVLILTNPGIIPFMPAPVKGVLTLAMNALFGDVSNAASVIPFSWTTVFQLVIMVLLLQIVSMLVQTILSSLNPKSGRGKTVLHLVLSGYSYLVGCVGVFWALSILGVDIATLFASLGILALVVGFGAESLIADLVTGVFMIFENEFNVGDIIELGGYRGTVTSIGIRTTCVTDFGGNEKIINNSDMRNVINLSNRGSFAVCDFPVPYEVKLADAEKALEKVLADIQAENPGMFPEKPTYAGVQQLAASAVILRVVANVTEENRFAAARVLNRGLKEGMEQLGISCPYDQIVVHKAQ